MVNCNEMMKIKISKCLEAAMATLVFKLKRDGVVTSYVDRLALELIADDSTFASSITSLMLGDDAKSVVCERIRELVGCASDIETEEPEVYFKSICKTLFRQTNASKLSSAHLLCWALRNSGSATAKAFLEHGIIAEEVVDVMYQLASSTDDDKTNI